MCIYIFVCTYKNSIPWGIMYFSYIYIQYTHILHSCTCILIDTHKKIKLTICGNDNMLPVNFLGRVKGVDFYSLV